MEKNNKNDGVAFTSEQVFLFTQPNSKVLRFAVYNPEHTKIKFFYNEEVCSANSVESRREHDKILYEVYPLHGSFKISSVAVYEPITNLPSLDKPVIKSNVYTEEQIGGMLTILRPYLQPTCKLLLEDWIKIDKEFSAYQREQLKECECDSNAKTVFFIL